MYKRQVDLILDEDGELTPEPFIELTENETFLSALGKLGVAHDALGHVVGPGGKTMGFITGRELHLALLRAE